MEKLEAKIKKITNESVILPKRPLATASSAVSENHERPPQVENGPGVTPNANDFPVAGFGGGDEGQEDDIFGGDVSSIMIKPDQILND